MEPGTEQHSDDLAKREEELLSFHIAGLPIDPRIAVYSTIILMSGLALLDFQDTELS
jgi:hypothetical protein